MPLAQGRLGRWIYSMTLAPIMVRIVGCPGKFCGYLPESPSEYAGKRLKMVVSKRLADYHRAAGKISVLYAHARGSYGGWDSTRVNNLKKEGLLCRVVME